MKIIIAVLILYTCASCSKKNNAEPIPDPMPVVIPDTLGAGWTAINVTPGSMISDIFFTDNLNGYLVSKSGIYKSTNGGNSWLQKNSSIGCYNIAAKDNNALFIQSGLPPIVSNDGSTTFQSVNPYPAGDLPTDAFFTSINNCHVSNTTSNHKSVDGGQTFPIHNSFPNNSSYCTLFFLNDLFGWTLRSDKLYKTADGGTTWNLLSAVNSNSSTIEFTDLTIGYYSAQPTVYKTIDGGNNWQQVFTGSKNSFTDIDFVNANEGYVSNGNQIYKTINAGNTWTKIVGLSSTNIIEIHFTDATHGWACCENGTILKFN